MKTDLRKREQKEIFKLFMFNPLSPEELYITIKTEDINDIMSFLNIDLKTIQYIRSLNLSSFMSLYKKFLINKHKYFKRSKFVKNLYKGGVV